MQILSIDLGWKIRILGHNSYFSCLGAEELRELAPATSLRLYERGEALFWQGDPCAGLYILQSRSIKLFKLSAKGRELVIKVITSGATFNEVPMFDSDLNVVNTAALHESEVWVVNPEIILRTMLNNPTVRFCPGLRLAIGFFWFQQYDQPDCANISE